MSRESLKLTCYFGERQRTQGRFAADALLDLYGRERIATSILLRGAEGFGARRRPRTDRSLTLSEDLPLAAIAVDERSRIEPLVEPAGRLTGTGLVTLERARLVNGDAQAWSLLDAGLAGTADELKLTIYLGRQERVYRVPAFMAVCDLLHRRGVAGATVLLGVDGTVLGVRERAMFFSRNADTPMMVIAVGSSDQIARVLPELSGLLQHPLLTVERVKICKRDGQLLDRPGAEAATRAEGGSQAEDDSQAEDGPRSWQKLMVYTSEAALHEGQPVHRALVRRLRIAGVSGATTLRGMWGFHGDHAPHGDRLFQLGRHVPTVTVVIESADHIETAFAIIDELTGDRGLVTSEFIPACHYPGARTSGSRATSRRE
jgi:PII-like signaling protein